MQPTVSINFDLELLTGWHHLDDAGYQQYRAEMVDARERIKRLVDILDEWSIPTTWNTVGHLFLQECDGHPGLGPIERDPETDHSESPLWYAPDLIRYLLESEAEIEIGSHSFAHDVFRGLSSERARADLETFEEMVDASGLDINPTSFIFPQNGEDHHDLLAEYGYLVYRSHRTPYYERGDSIAAKVHKAWLLATGGERGRPTQPKIDEYGMVRIDESIYLSRGGAGGLGGMLCRSPLRPSLPAYLSEQIEHLSGQDHLHLWAHPHEFENGLPRERFVAVCDILETAAEQGQIKLQTMTEVAESVLEREAVDTVHIEH